MLMFSQLRRGALVPAFLAPVDEQLKAFAVRFEDGGLQVCLINKDEQHGTRVDIDLGHNFATASMIRLRGPGATATDGVTLGEASIGDNGAWLPTRTPLLRSADRRITIDVLPASAALIAMRT